MDRDLEVLERSIASGLLPFPTTLLTPGGEAADHEALASHRNRLPPFPAAGLFVAGGIGKFLSLSPNGNEQVVALSKPACGSLDATWDWSELR